MNLYVENNVRSFSDDLKGRWNVGVDMDACGWVVFVMR